ncbi:MAG: hypothetical protein IMZ44_22690 [Planctomycetes bacterium]|nr:hypothetical protein [Planctomycetota bacterium]
MACVPNGKALALMAALVVSAACLGCGHRPTRDQYGDIIPERFPQWLSAKENLPQQACDGSTPQQIRDRFLDKIKAGDAEAASRALELVRSVIAKDGGIYSLQLSEVAAAALRVRPDPEFVYLLVRNIPNESIFYYRRDRDSQPTWGFGYGVGYSEDVLKAVPGAALEQLLRALDDESNDGYLSCCFLETIHLLQIWGAVPPWEAGAHVLALYRRYPHEERVHAGVEAVMYRLYAAQCGGGEPPPHYNVLDAALRQAQGGEIDEAWRLLTWVLQYSRFQIDVLQRFMADGLNGFLLGGVSLDLGSNTIRMDFRLDEDRVLPLQFYGVSDLKTNLSFAGAEWSQRKWRGRAMRMGAADAGWRVHIALEQDPSVSVDFTCTSIQFYEPPLAD